LQGSNGAKGWIIAALVALGTDVSLRTLIADILHGREGGVVHPQGSRIAEAAHKLMAAYELQVRLLYRAWCAKLTVLFAAQ
jgi:hypothetical protein